MVFGLVHFDFVNVPGGSPGAARIGGAHFDPRFQIGDLLVGKLLVVRRHLEVLVRVTNSADEKTFFGVAGDNGRAAIAAFLPAFAAVKEKAAFEFLRSLAVALVAIVDEDGTDL